MLMKHISNGFDRICGTPVPEQGGYMSDEAHSRLPECPVCYESKRPLGLLRGGVYEPKVNKRVEQPITTKQSLYLRQYLEYVSGQTKATERASE